MSNKPTTLDDTLQLRCKHQEKKKFVDHCRLKMKRPYQDVIREMMIALSDGRMTITPTEEQLSAMKESDNVYRK